MSDHFNLITILIDLEGRDLENILSDSAIIGSSLTIQQIKNSKVTPTIEQIRKDVDFKKIPFNLDYINVLLPVEMVHPIYEISRQESGITNEVIMGADDVIYKVEQRPNGSIMYQLTENYNTEKFDQEFYDTYLKFYEYLVERVKKIKTSNN
jgi:hypothetical protein